MSVTIDKKRKIFKLDTQNSSYVFCVSKVGLLEHLYYGKRVEDTDLRYVSHTARYSFTFLPNPKDLEYSVSVVLLENPSYNAGGYGISALQTENADGTKGNRLLYKSYSVYQCRREIEGLPCSRNAEDCETLEIVLEDEEKGIEVTLFYVVYPTQDVIARYQKITNLAKTTAYLEKAASFCVGFNSGDYDLLQLCGGYAYERSIEQRTAVERGVWSNGSPLGSTSHFTNPFFALLGKSTDEHSGAAYGFNLVYSGSFLNEIEKDCFGNIRAISGVNPAGFRWALKSGESFYTPEGIMTYSDDGVGGISRNFHDHIRANLIERNFVNLERPIVVNTWEGSRFSVNEKSVLELADQALTVGADTVILDDGWFRNNDKTGLGDWNILKEKFPKGLAWLSKEIKKKGLNFGVWIEPEMAAVNSDFARNYPQRVLKNRNNAYTSRNQYVVDLTSDETVEYIFERIATALEGVEIDYIKWDANRYLTECASLVCPSGEVFHRQMLGVYKLFNKFKEKYPNILFENCSGGGGRFDLGMLYYAPQIWASDHTDPYGRIAIQYGTSLAYPTSSISCHYTRGRGCTGRKSSPSFRFLTACFGPYGYELDLTELAADEKQKLKAFTEKYRARSKFNYDCDLYRLISPEKNNFCAYMQVTKDKKEALFTFLQTTACTEIQSIVVKLRGLDENTVYENLETRQKLTGGAWMSVGIRISKLWAKSGSGKQILFRAID